MGKVQDETLEDVQASIYVEESNGSVALRLGKAGNDGSYAHAVGYGFPSRVDAVLSIKGYYYNAMLSCVSF